VSEGVRIPDSVLAGVEAAINGYIALDPEGAARIEEIQGRVILMELTGFGTRLYLIPESAGLQLYGDYAGEPDCVLRGTPLALARMSASRRKEDQLFSGEVRVEGDTHLAQAFSDFMERLDVDWEEQLSRLIGDPAAHQVGSRARAAGRWGRRAGKVLTEDIKEYLQEEARLLPGPYEVHAFLDDVDRLRDDTDRLVARVERLARARQAASGRKPPVSSSRAGRSDSEMPADQNRNGE